MRDDELFELLEGQTTAGQCRAVGQAFRNLVAVFVAEVVDLARRAGGRWRVR